MKTFFIVAYLIAMAVVTVSHVVLPDEVAIHFNASGEADDWAPKIVNTLLFGGLFSFFFVLFLWIPRLIVAMPKDMVNLPHKEYWLADGHRDEAVRIFARLMHEFGAVLLLFFIGIVVLTMQANMAAHARLDNTLFFTGLVVYLGYTGWWCVRIVRAFRLPAV